MDRETEYLRIHIYEHMRCTISAMEGEIAQCRIYMTQFRDKRDYFVRELDGYLVAQTALMEAMRSMEETEPVITYRKLISRDNMPDDPRYEPDDDD